MKTAFPMLLLVISALLSPLSVEAQHHLSTYNLQSVPQAFRLQPGRMPQADFYITALPTGFTSLNLRKRGFELSALETLLEDPVGMDGEEGSFFDLDFSPVIAGLSPENDLQMDFQTHWLSLGFRASRNFFHLEANEHINASIRMPRALFELFNDLDFDNPLNNSGSYNLGSLGAELNHFRSYGLGYTRQINPSLSVGFKVSLLQGIGSIFTENNQFSIVNNTDSLSLRISGNIGVSTSGFSDQTNYFNPKGNRGVALDFGLNYLPSEKLELSASLLNIGQIRWSRDLSFEGIYAADYQFPTDDPDAFESEFGRFLDSLSSEAGASPTPYLTRLPAMGYLNANYYFGKQTALNLTLNPRFHNNQVDLAYALGLHTRIRKILQLSLNYAIIQGNRLEAGMLGAGLSLNLGPLQFFAATNDILAARKVPEVDNFQVQAGISLSFGRRTRTEQLALFNPAFAESTPLTQQQEPERSAEALAPPKKPVKSAQMSKPSKPNSVAETTDAPLPAAALNQYCTFRASATDKVTNAAVTSIQVMIYALDGQQEQLVFTRYFYSGNVEVPLERNRDYRILFRNNAYQEQSIRLSKTDIQQTNDIVRNIQLNLKTL
jgi:hypothetical protein